MTGFAEARRDTNARGCRNRIEVVPMKSAVKVSEAIARLRKHGDTAELEEAVDDFLAAYGELRSQFYYEDWQGVRHKKNKRGFKTKAEAEEWERNPRQQQRKDLDINFENFVEIYFSDVENRLREAVQLLR